MLTITEQNFQQEVLDATEPVLLDFYATWCRPCHILTPILENISNKVDAKIGKVNTDENSTLTSTYKIQALPTLIFFKNGKEVNRLVGLQSESVIQNILEGLCND